MHSTLQRLVDANVPMELNPPATPEAIAQFEQEQGIQFPEYYREFLLFANGGMLYSEDFFGIDSESEHFSLVKKNYSGEDTTRYFCKIPDSLYIVGCTGYGNPLCIDLKSQEFVNWEHETSEEWYRLTSLFDYIDQTIDGYEEEQALQKIRKTS